MYDNWIVYVEAIKGKNTRKTHDMVKTRIIALPAEILEKNKIVTLDTELYKQNSFLSQSESSTYT